jgi:hypothetical protein
MHLYRVIHIMFLNSFFSFSSDDIVGHALRACPMAAVGLGPRLAPARAWTRLVCMCGAGTGACLPMAKAPGRLHDHQETRFSPLLSNSSSSFSNYTSFFYPWQGIWSFTRPIAGTGSRQGSHGQGRFCRGDYKLKWRLTTPLAPFLKFQPGSTTRSSGPGPGPGVIGHALRAQVL